jgi:hypothetical protein
VVQRVGLLVVYIYVFFFFFFFFFHFNGGLHVGLMALAVLASCDGDISWCFYGFGAFGVCDDGAASERLNRIGVVGVYTTEGGFGNHGSPMEFANDAAICIKVDWSM